MLIQPREELQFSTNSAPNQDDGKMMSFCTCFGIHGKQLESRETGQMWSALTLTPIFDRAKL